MDALLDQFKKNYEYDHWANDQFLTVLTEMPQPPEKAVKIMAHILFALDVWLARLKKEDTSRFTDPNPSYSLSECRQKLDELHTKWRDYLAYLRPEQMQEKFISVNTQGKRTEQIVQNVLMHVANHSHYHRGQLAGLVSQGGGKRPNTDFIGYVFSIGEAKHL